MVEFAMMQASGITNEAEAGCWDRQLDHNKSSEHWVSVR